MNIKLPSIAPPIKDVTVGKETQKQVIEGGGLSRTFDKLLQEVNQQQFIIIDLIYLSFI